MRVGPAFAAVAALVLAAAALAAPPKELITSANSGPGAAAVASVPSTHGYSKLTLRVTTQPSGLPVQVEWRLECPGIRRGRLTLRSPFMRTITATKKCAVSLQGQLWVSGGKVASGTIRAAILGG